MSSQGHVNTTDYDGTPLLLLFLLDKREDVDEIRADLDNQDVNGRNPLSESQPCNVLVMIISPNERVHMTVKPASSALWASEPPFVRGIVHVYSANDITANGFESYLIQSTSKTKYGSATMKTAVDNAMAKPYTQKSHGSSSRSHGSSSENQGTGKPEQQPSGYFDNGVPYYYSESQQKYYYIGSDGKRQPC
ncbi:uncharacterized protein VDAG_03365 [Verticillium dahliae VdLs.17]|uniref:Uncharacterized protein n=1 Tax=Verticillium dahliae (strain VdLs.17 / ATCC MYA-4575 / FGSC 10137) TaxID=498257 RepID=G2WZC3_VERDV|nr:uncharacterized protein VDAG_03365 [Verticillium dahliae VdLs.17]EGY21925.1 hypothetical protein VDAG_03365 [Verticillium dahliae VdLs.17]